MSRPALWAVILDRDGTLVPDRGYPVRPAQLKPYPGAAEALLRLARAGASLAVVSNQSAVGRGFLSPEGLEAMDRELKRLFAPVRFSGTYYCPHAPEAGCSCRKPQPELVHRALKETGAPPERSFLVGDSISDLQAGRRAGVTSILVLTGGGRRHRSEALRRGLADKVSRTVATAADWILGRVEL